MIHKNSKWRIVTEDELYELYKIGLHRFDYGGQCVVPKNAFFITHEKAIVKLGTNYDYIEKGFESYSGKINYICIKQ